MVVAVDTKQCHGKCFIVQHLVTLLYIVCNQNIIANRKRGLWCVEMTSRIVLHLLVAHCFDEDCQLGLLFHFVSSPNLVGGNAASASVGYCTWPLSKLTFDTSCIHIEM